MHRVPSSNALRKMPTGSLILFVRALNGKRAAAKLQSCSLEKELLAAYSKELMRRGIRI